MMGCIFRLIKIEEMKNEEINLHSFGKILREMGKYDLAELPPNDTFDSLFIFGSWHSDS